MNAIGREIALLHFFFKENPDKWSDEEYAIKRARLFCALDIMKNTGIQI